MVTTTKCPQTNRVRFFQSGVQVYPVSISGNIAEFENGEIVIF